jgi:hypothetical protein
MKTFVLMTVMAGALMQGFAQGTIAFANRGLFDPQLGLYEARVSLPDGSFADGRFAAGLFLVEPNQLTLLGTTPFRSGPAAGFFLPVGFQVPGIPAGCPATFRARVWDTAASSYEAAAAAGLLHGEFPTRNPENNILVDRLGGTLGPDITPQTDGILPFTLVPEPSPIALFCGAAVLLSLLRKRSRPGFLNKRETNQ